MQATFASKQKIESSDIQKFLEKNAQGFITQNSVYEMNSDIVVFRFNQSL